MTTVEVKTDGVTERQEDKPKTLCLRRNCKKLCHGRFCFKHSQELEGVKKIDRENVVPRKSPAEIAGEKEKSA